MGPDGFQTVPAGRGRDRRAPVQILQRPAEEAQKPREEPAGPREGDGAAEEEGKKEEAAPEAKQEQNPYDMLPTDE